MGNNREEALDLARVGACLCRADGTLLGLDRRLFRILGLERRFASAADAVGRRIDEFVLRPRQRDGGEHDLIAEGSRRGACFGFETIGGETRWLLQDSYWVRHPGTNERRARLILRDVTERFRAEQELVRRDAILQAVNFAAERFLLDPTGWRANIRPVLERLGQAAGASRVYIFENVRGPSGDSGVSQRFEWVRAGTEPQIDNPRLQDLPYHEAGFDRWARVLGAGRPIHGHVRDFPRTERAILEPQGILSIAVVPVFAGREFWGFVGFDECSGERGWTTAEVEALKAAANTLGAAIQRQRTDAELQLKEAQFRQAQKMEAVGRLAGGIAHDFNNLLTAIAGYGELMQKNLRPEDPLYPQVEQIRIAAERAGSLTRRLLAFSRKQALEPELLDVNGIVGAMSDMLGRLIGEDVRVLTRLDGDLPAIRADRGQIEQVVLNLAVNARDAMPDGGELHVGTSPLVLERPRVTSHAQVEPGAWVVLEVRDTGCGMDGETMSRIFEPFFTTKERDRGTGLGLATVYGIVAQSGGRVDVESAPGRGSSFRIYLPAVDRSAERPGREHRERPETVGGAETVLLVEDEAMVRDLARTVLERNGYRVISAASGGEALRLAREHDGPVHLLVSDVVLPELSGKDLYERLSAERPDVKVLFTSGYSDSVVLDWTQSRARGEFLQKPFTPTALLERVRRLLDSPFAAA